MAEETAQRVRRKSSKKGGSCAIQHPKNELNSLLFHQWVYDLPRSSPKVFTPDAGDHDLRRDITTQLCPGFHSRGRSLARTELWGKWKIICCWLHPTVSKCLLLLPLLSCSLGGGWGWVGNTRGMQLTALIRSWIIASTGDKMSDRRDGWRCFDQGLKYDSRAKGQSQWRQFWFTINCCLLTTQ